MKVSIAVERLQYGYVTVDVDSLDEAKEIQDFNGYDVTSQTTEDWHVPDTLLNKDGWYEVEEGEEAKLKPCPFCGGAKICTEKSINLNYCDNCSAESNVEHWNTRPIEDELRARIAELEAAQRWVPVSERLPKESGWYRVGAINVFYEGYTDEVYFEANKTKSGWQSSVRDEIYCWLDGVPELPLPQLPEEREE